MTFDLSERLRQAAGPLPELDEATLHRLTRRRRRSGYAAAAVIGVVVTLVAAATVGLLATRPDDDVQLAPADGSPGNEESGGAPPASARLGDVEWEVLTVAVSPALSVVGHVVTDQPSLDRLWETFEADGPAPTLSSEQAALVLPLAGTCDDAAQAHGLEGIATADGTRTYAAVQVDGNCAAQLPGHGVVHPPPRTLYVIAVPVEVAEDLAGVVAVVGSVADFDWKVLSVGATETGPGAIVVTDQKGVDSTWPMFQMPGPAPALPEGRGALFLAVPGSCDNADQVQAVRVIATDENPAEPHVLGGAYFDPNCAEPLISGTTTPSPRTLYVLAVPLEVAESVGGSIEFIACPAIHTAERRECADPTDQAVPAYP